MPLKNMDLLHSMIHDGQRSQSISYAGRQGEERDMTGHIHVGG